MAQSSTLPPSELYKYQQQIIFSPNNFSGPLKSSPNGEILPNMVTLLGRHVHEPRQSIVFAFSVGILEFECHLDKSVIIARKTRF
jgi:hypothetical protein